MCQDGRGDIQISADCTKKDESGSEDKRGQCGQKASAGHRKDTERTANGQQKRTKKVSAGGQGVNLNKNTEQTEVETR